MNFIKIFKSIQLNYESVSRKIVLKLTISVSTKCHFKSELCTVNNKECSIDYEHYNDISSFKRSE